MGPSLAAELDDVREAVGCHQRRACPPSLKQGVGGHGHAMRESVHFIRGRVRIGQHRSDRFDDPDGLVRRGRGSLRAIEAAAGHERLTKAKALAVLSSDALSSVAYATEEIMRVLLLAGTAALTTSLPIGGVLVVLLFVVGFSYRQTIKAYPTGGGSYIVAKDNLGTLPGLAAAGSLFEAFVM